MVSDQGELPASELSSKKIHNPDGSLHFKQKWSGTVLVLLQLSAGISNDTVLPTQIDLGEDGTETPWLFLITQAGIND